MPNVMYEDDFCLKVFACVQINEFIHPVRLDANNDVMLSYFGFLKKKSNVFMTINKEMQSLIQIFDILDKCV